MFFLHYSGWSCQVPVAMIVFAMFAARNGFCSSWRIALCALLLLLLDALQYL